MRYFPTRLIDSTTITLLRRLTTHGVNSLIAFIEEHKALLSVAPHSVEEIASHPTLKQAAGKEDKKRDFLYY